MREMNAKKVIVTMTDGTVFRGSINIGNARRVSDYFRKDDWTFMVLFSAAKVGEEREDVYFINRNHILWVKPVDSPAGAGAAEDSAISLEHETDLE